MTAMHSRLSRQHQMPAWQRVGVGLVTGLLAGAATLVIGGHASAATSPAASSPAGNVAGVPATSSEVTVSGRGEFSNLKITVSQTQNLVNQAIGISWTGGAPTNINGVLFGNNFLQIMECWGNPVTDDSTLADADNDIPANPGPPREQCEFGVGAETSVIGAKAPFSTVREGDDATRYVDYNPDPTSQLEDNLYQSGEVPFRAVDGTVVPQQDPDDTWANKYYDETTSNEIPFNYTLPDGTGSTVFEADTALEAPGLGCGDPVSHPACWLVVVPRGDTDINGQPLPGSNTFNMGSPLSSPNWQNRIAIPLSYRSVQGSCPIGLGEHPTEGSELVTAAMVSWDSSLCATSNTAFSNVANGDDQARQGLTGGLSGLGGGELGFVSRPVDPSTVPPGENIVYAPVTLSGVTISFEIDDWTTGSAGPPVTQVNLTPRLVAKLLTDSYAAANLYRDGAPGVTGFKGTPPPADYAWLAKNPPNLFADPDFQQYNPQFAGIKDSPTSVFPIGSVLIELNGSDAAYELWNWILADPSARAFLAGQPDPWGMTVDPYFSTSASINPAHAGLSLPTETFPDPDPWQSVQTQPDLCGQLPTSLPMTSFVPFDDSMSDVALHVLQDNNLQKITWVANCSGVSAYASDFTLTPPGERAIMGVSTTDSADHWGVLDASLQNAAGNFVAPDTASLLAGEAAMEPSEVAGVLQPDFSSTSPDAYPLSLLTYAAVPLGTVTKSNCAAYARLLDYASGPGQVPGDQLGQLPLGYAPLPAQLTIQTATAAAEVAACPQAPGGGAPSSSQVPGAAQMASGGPGTGNLRGEGPAPTSGSAGTGVTPAGGPAGVSQPVQLTGGFTPANPAVFGYGLPIGAAAGLFAGLAAPLFSRRRLQLLRALRLPALPRLARQPARPSRLPWLRGRWRGSP